ncbi:hypothetical protein RclHR1_05590008 [Rhizophagus clarus]|uniref:Uncharacterized protein n=1 Tax=Rhizophagus clarus TaxID=94130 RepID=A0A2Z6RTV0_9GLOM|nr:hypothetical protein RclHR1_05590008 [Rhizophagus clarus]
MVPLICQYAEDNISNLFALVAFLSRINMRKSVVNESLLSEAQSQPDFNQSSTRLQTNNIYSRTWAPYFVIVLIPISYTVYPEICEAP